jgi:hypothetical protein
MSQPRPSPAPRRCQLCGAATKLRRAAIVRPSVVEEIRREHPG